MTEDETIKLQCNKVITMFDQAIVFQDINEAAENTKKEFNKLSIMFIKH